MGQLILLSLYALALLPLFGMYPLGQWLASWQFPGSVWVRGVMLAVMAAYPVFVLWLTTQFTAAYDRKFPQESGQLWQPRTFNSGLGTAGMLLFVGTAFGILETSRSVQLLLPIGAVFLGAAVARMAAFTARLSRDGSEKWFVYLFSTFLWVIFQFIDKAMSGIEALAVAGYLLSLVITARMGK